MYKLLGVNIYNALKWDDHIAATLSKASKRIWFLKKHKRAGVSTDDLLYYYQTVVRPVLEYACVVWHSCLTKEQVQSLGNVQRRALQIIVGNTSYISACSTLGISQLSDRHREQCALMFRRIVSDQSHVLHYLLPAKRDLQLTERLRSAKPYPSVRTRTTRFQNSYIPFSLTNFR